MKLLGYVWTWSGDNIGLRKSILRMPRAYSEAHEMTCFQRLLKSFLQKVASSGRKFDFQKVLWNASIVSELTPEHSWDVPVQFTSNFRPLERFWSDFKQNEKNDFSKNFCLDFKHILCINPYQNSNIFYFLNFFSKMRPLIKNPKRWSF